uniref:HAT C-terminal dimerisation domain-containing protein n=1 Tax=Timema cristinae TaxID=61476 RepID=A0A7R9H2Q6_TIMCR|nr:unnamed protein product [Timema cristinae]
MKGDSDLKTVPSQQSLGKGPETSSRVSEGSSVGCRSADHLSQCCALNRLFAVSFGALTFEEKQQVIMKDKTVTEIMKFLEETDLAKEAFQETYKLCCLISTIPVSTSTVERTFSCLKRIKTTVRNTQCENRLSTLSLLSVEKGLLDELQSQKSFYDAVIDQFIQKVKAGAASRRVYTVGLALILKLLYSQFKAFRGVMKRRLTSTFQETRIALKKHLVCPHMEKNLAGALVYNDSTNMSMLANQLVFVFQIPLPRDMKQLDYSRWQQNLIGILQLDIAYFTDIEMEERVIITLDSKLGYRNKGDPDDDWKMSRAPAKLLYLLGVSGSLPEPQTLLQLRQRGETDASNIVITAGLVHWSSDE